jgi:replicative DNA helicase
LVAGALIKPELVSEAVKFVSSLDFEDARLSLIWGSIVSLIDDGATAEQIDPFSVAKGCTSNDSVQRKIAIYASELLDQFPKSGSLLNSAQRVRRRATLRSTLTDMREIAMEIKEQLGSVDGEVDNLETRLSQLSIKVSMRSDVVSNRTTFKEAAIEVGKYFDELASGPNTYAIPTGIPRLDKKLGGGLRPGQLHSILGGTGSGKTALASQICDEAVKRGHRAIMFSMEVDPMDVYIRDVERLSGRSRWDLRSPAHITREKASEALVEAQATILNQKDSKIIYGEPMSVEGIRQAILTEKLRGGEIEVVCVDHAQVAKPSGDEKANRPRYLEVKSVAEGLRAIARQLNIAMVLTAQLNPPQKGEQPTMDSVRESKDINNCSEVVMLIWHKKEEAPNGDTVVTGSFIILDKVRTGTCGKVPVYYRGEVYRFEEQE